MSLLPELMDSVMTFEPIVLGPSVTADAGDDVDTVVDVLNGLVYTRVGIIAAVAVVTSLPVCK